MTESARITRADVEHVAQLARLALTEDEIDALTGELGAILEHAAQVSALDTEGVRADRAPAAARERAPARRGPARRSTATRCWRQAPAAEDGRFRVPRILGEAP